MRIANKAIFMLFIFPFYLSAQFAIDLPVISNLYDSAIDKDGNSYYFGLYGANNNLPFDFDPGPGEHKLPFTGTPFLASYTSSGQLRFAFTLEDLSPSHFGDLSLMPPTLALDSASNIYISSALTGWLDFDPGPDIHELKTTSTNYKIGYIASYTSDGEFRYVTPLGITTNPKIYLDVSNSGNAYFTYTLRGKTDLDPSSGTFEIGEDNHHSYIIASLDPNGGLRFAYAFLTRPGSNINTGARINLDSEENVYLSNLLFRYIDLDPGPNLVNLGADSLDSERFYIASYDKNGAFRFANLVCENFNPGTLCVVYYFDVDDFGNSYIVSSTAGGVNFDLVNTFEITNYSYDLFLSSYDENGNFRFAFTIGFPDQISSNGSVAQPFDICINEQNNIIITGAYSGLKDFDPGSQVTLIPGSEQTPGAYRTFIAEYSNNGNLVQLYGFEGPSGSSGYNVSTNIKDQILVSGLFGDEEIDFDLGPGIFNLNPQITGHFATVLGDFSSASSVNEHPFSPPAISIFPNPVIESTSVKINNTMNQWMRLTIVNPNGVVINQLFEGISNSNELILNWRPEKGMNSGVYFLQCTTRKGQYLMPMTVLR